MIISEEIAKFIEKTNFNDFSQEIIEKAKQCILDVIGVTLYGSTFYASDICLSVVNDFSDHKKEATILGKKQKTSSVFAAMVNGISAHITDYDDYLKYFGHPSSVLISALLPVAESKNVNGRDFITAFILGVEIGSKLGTSMSMNHYQVGFHTTSTVGVIAASIALSKLLKFNVSQTINAIGVATSCSSGIRQN
ncbi:MAG: MmgE/PrpD family protein, partial [Atribacterota bacterium]|nr:MmgE/PrpD family protein [Atribacterota bacterium]